MVARARRSKDKKELKEKAGTILVILDHKSKTYPQSKQESMSEFFGKNGISGLGAMVQWYGKKDGKEGCYTWFYDYIMHDVNSQDARDLMPALEALLKELKSEEFKKIYKDNNSGDANSPESPEEIILCSDNKLSSASLTPFIAFLNTKSGSGELQIIDWINNEAQRDKDFLDAHF